MNEVKYTSTKITEKIIKTYARIAKKQDIVRMRDLVDAGFTADQIKHYFKSLARLNQIAREKYPDSFFDVYLANQLTPDNTKRLQNVLKSYKKFIITTAVTGCRADPDMIAAIESYCEKNDAHALILVASDPAHNIFAPGANYGTIDTRLLGSDHMTLVVSDVMLNTNLFISTVKLSAKQVDPATSMGRIAAKKGTFIFASPKQRLKAVPVSNNKYPNFVMTTGAVTVPDYSTTNYMSGRTAFIAEADHVMGALVVEIESKKIYHFRQLQLDSDGNLTDLGVSYTPSGQTIDNKPAAFVLGDWHAGSTDPVAKQTWISVIKELGIKRVVLHDAFDGLSINHHERENVLQRAANVRDNKHDLRSEIEQLASDLEELTNLVDEVIIVKSNHDEFLTRYLQSGYYVKDPQNHRYSLELAIKAIDGEDPLKYAVESCGKLKNKDKVRWLDRDENYLIAGIQLGAHGDIGANGSRGGLRNIESAYNLSVTGHTHTPEILRGAWCVGTSSLLRLNYNRGPSSWMHTSCLVYENGCRQLINCIEGRWRVKKRPTAQSSKDT